MSKKAIWIVALLVGFGAGGVGGFFAGVATSGIGKQMLEDAMSAEQPADVDNVKTLSRKHYAVSYPGNWTENVPTEDGQPEADLEYYTSLDSPGNNYTQIVVYDIPTETSSNVADYEKTESIYLKNPTKAKFSRWGKYQGHGVELKGMVMGLNKGGMRIFSHSNDKKSFIIMEHYFDDDQTETAPGSALIKQTFQLK